MMIAVRIGFIVAQAGDDAAEAAAASSPAHGYQGATSTVTSAV